MDQPRKKFYISTAINYTNGPPHFGHAYEAVAADVIARYHRVNGEEVFFMTGTDEHGQKVAETAASQQLKPIQLCDMFVEAFQTLNKKLQISNDFYIRTTMPKHYKTSQWLWKTAAEAGDIYLSDYTGWYSVREEKFLTENEAKMTDYKDPGSGKPLMKRSEPSYFFKMSKYRDQLLDHINNNPDFIQPEERRKEVLARLENEPLLDLSISRATFDWGVPVPDVPGFNVEQKHVMYVWFDALTNYLSGVDYPDGKLAHFWPASVHLIGKDIIWFHAVIWPCMLMSVKVPLPKTILSHGFVNGPDGRKMSKSYGNVVDPNKILEKFTSDNLRFFMMKEGAFGSDFNFSEDALINTHDYELAAALGNLVQRGLTLASKYTNSEVPSAPYEEIFSVSELKTNVGGAMEKFLIQNAVEFAFAACRLTNKYLTEQEPWHLKGEGSEQKRASILRTVLEAVYIFGHFIAPFIPQAMEQVYAALGTPMTTLDKLHGWGNLKPGTKVTVLPEVLFKRIQQNRFEKGQEAEVEEKKGGKAQAKAPAKPKNAPNDIALFNLVVGKIVSCKNHPEADHLYVEEIDIGGPKPIQVVSGLAKFIPLDQMTGRSVIVVKNMKASKFRGVQSEGMVIAANNTENTVVELVAPPTGAVPGERVKFAGYAEDGVVDALNKNQIDKVKADLKTDANCVATYKGVPFMTSAGACKVASLKDSQLG